jgi:protein involved in polysaccharide export with SLBB domain
MIFRRVFQLPGTVCFLLLAFQIVGAARALAQEAPQSGASSPGAMDETATSLLLDAPVSRTEYTVGPGDRLVLSVFGSIDRLHELTVTPDGTLVIPSVGLARVRGLNLDEAQTEVRDLVLRYYRDVQVNLTLARARLFKVFVVGDVPEPGLRVASSVTRVSEVVPGTGTTGIVRRNVLLRRAAEGDTVSVDLVRFRQTGDLSANPTLREGDAVVVPTIDETVQVYGRVYFPGSYEYRRNESLADLLSIVNGSRDFPSNAADTVRLTRFVSPTQREFHVLSRSEALGERGRSFVLQPADAIYVATVANFKEQKVATVLGQVQHPGTYPIRPDTTTVRDLITLAGGFTPEASLVDATLRRTAARASDEATRQLQRVPPELLSDDERRILQIRAAGDESNVVINFQEIFSQDGDAYNQTLESADVLTVPERRDEVVILGAVTQPGIVDYTRGRGVNHYIALAGGYTRRADRGDVVVLKAKLGTRLGIREVEQLDPGDKIIVPFKEPPRVLERLQATNAIIGTISGLVVTILTLERLF